MTSSALVFIVCISLPMMVQHEGTEGTESERGGLSWDLFMVR